MFSAEVWCAEMKDAGYLHARAGAAEALLRPGERERACELAHAECHFPGLTHCNQVRRHTAVLETAFPGIGPLRDSRQIVCRFKYRSDSER